MKVKINKKKVIICIILIIALIATPVFGRYIYNSVRDLYLKSRNFSFSSDLLTTSGITYKYSNWSGVDNYEIDFQLYSYENELSLFTYDGEGLQYTVSCTVDDSTKATAHVGTAAGESTGSGYIPNTTNIKDVKVYLTPTANLKEGDTVKLTVTASTTEPYEKTIKATFNIKIENQNLSYSIEDQSSSIYATLKLINTKSEQNKIKLSFDPSVVRIDVTNEYYENRLEQTSETITVDGVDVEYVNSITFNMEAEDVKNIRFYKIDTNANYTYPSGTADSMVVTITEVE